MFFSTRTSPNEDGTAIFTCSSEPHGCLAATGIKAVRACLHGGGRPQVGEVTFGGSPHLSCKRDQIKMGDYMDRRVTSPTWGPPPPC